MKTRNEIISYCKTFAQVYEDYPFRNSNSTVMRHRGNKKLYAMIYEMEETLRINVKADPEWIEVWKQTYTSVLPGYHMNKKYWITLVVDGNIPDRDIKRMIAESYDLVKPKRKKNQQSNG